MSKPGRYAAELIASGVLRRLGKEGEAADRHVATAVKFAMPENGVFFASGDRVKLPRPTHLRLPYPAIVLEFDVGRLGATVPTVVLATDSTTGLTVNVMLNQHGGWVPVPADIRVNSALEYGIRAEDFWSAIPNQSAANDVVAWIKGSLLHERAVLAVLSFLTILECSNVRSERIEVPPRLAQKRSRRGEPSFEYHVLTIPGEAGAREDHGGTHASPRQHLRRGHIRRLTDHTIWVNACVVGRRDLGEVEKDYRVVQP